MKFNQLGCCTNFLKKLFQTSITPEPSQPEKVRLRPSQALQNELARQESQGPQQLADTERDHWRHNLTSGLDLVSQPSPETFFGCLSNTNCPMPVSLHFTPVWWSQFTGSISQIGIAMTASSTRQFRLQRHLV